MTKWKKNRAATCIIVELQLATYCDGILRSARFGPGRGGTTDVGRDSTYIESRRGAGERTDTKCGFRVGEGSGFPKRVSSNADRCSIAVHVKGDFESRWK